MYAYPCILLFHPPFLTAPHSHILVYSPLYVIVPSFFCYCSTLAYNSLLTPVSYCSILLLLLLHIHIYLFTYPCMLLFHPPFVITPNSHILVYLPCMLLFHPPFVIAPHSHILVYLPLYVIVLSFFPLLTPVCYCSILLLLLLHTRI